MARMKLDKFKVERSIDRRGSLVKVISHSYVGRKVFGEIYSIFFRERSVRANHYHKLTTEWFTVIKGIVNLYLKCVKTKETKLVKLDGNEPICVRVDPLVAHALRPVTNEEAILIAYSNKEYDPDNTDTYRYEVIREEVT